MSNQSIEDASKLLQQASEILRGLANGNGQSTISLQNAQGGSRTVNNASSVINPSTSGSTISNANPGARNSLARASIQGSSATRNSISNVTRIMSASSRFSNSGNDTRAELSRLFQPYARESIPGSRNGRRTSGARQLADRAWNQKFFCLVSPKTTNSPSTASKVVMTQAGFGQEIIELALSMNSINLEAIIRGKYSKLPESVNFELLYQAGVGATGALLRISPNEPIPTAAVIHTAVRRQSIIYIRPYAEILTSSEDDDELEVDEFVEETIVEPENPPEQPSTLFSTSSSSNAQRNIVITLSDNEEPHHDELPQNGTFVLDGLEIEENHLQDSDANLDDMLTIDDLRRRTYEENPGVQPLHISRENYTMAVLGVYKHPRFNLIMEPDVTFIGSGEFGADAGALMREYFWTGMVAISSGLYMGRIILFEGDVDHKLPNSDAVLLSNHVFEYIGKFIGHSALHGGVGFVGLSQVVIEFMTQEDPTPDAMAGFISIKDVPDTEVVEALELLQEWPDVKEEYPYNIVESINKVAQQCDLTMTITRSSSSFAFDHILLHTVVTKRKPQLEAMRVGFQKSPVFGFLKTRPYLVKAVFPSTLQVQVPVDVLLRQIELEGGDNDSQVAFEMFLKCLKNILESDPKKTIDVLKAWTAWPFLTNQKLSLKVDGTKLDIKACYNEVTIPKHLDENSMINLINVILSDATVGFGNL